MACQAPSGTDGVTESRRSAADQSCETADSVARHDDSTVQNHGECGATAQRIDDDRNQSSGPLSYLCVPACGLPTGGSTCVELCANVDDGVAKGRHDRVDVGLVDDERR